VTHVSPVDQSLKVATFVGVAVSLDQLTVTVAVCVSIVVLSLIVLLSCLNRCGSDCYPYPSIVPTCYCVTLISPSPFVLCLSNAFTAVSYLLLFSLRTTLT